MRLWVVAVIEQDSHELLRQLLEGLRSEGMRAASTLKGEGQTAEKAAEKAAGGRRGRAGGGPGGVAGEEARAAAQAEARGEASGQERSGKEVSGKEVRTIVDEIFSGVIRSTIVCLRCGHVSSSRTHARAQTLV